MIWGVDEESRKIFVRTKFERGWFGPCKQCVFIGGNLLSYTKICILANRNQSFETLACVRNEAYLGFPLRFCCFHQYWSKCYSLQSYSLATKHFPFLSTGRMSILFPFRSKYNRVLWRSQNNVLKVFWSKLKAAISINWIRKEIEYYSHYQV